MIVIKAIEGNNDEVEEVKFDNGLTLSSDYESDCCTYNFLDFGQFVVGREFPTMGPEEIVKAAIAKEDGYAITDSMGIPAWIQARSSQNGYYSTNVHLVATLEKVCVAAEQVDGEVNY